MLTILGKPRKVCGNYTRRELLQAAGAGLLGVSLPKVLAAEEAPPALLKRAKSVIFLFLFGGPSQLETFDMKPAAPSNIRGPYRPIPSRTPDLRICEHLPRLAALSDKYCVVRTMTHQHNEHNACHHIQTGHEFPIVNRGASNVSPSDRDWPAMGSVVEYLDRQSGPPRQIPSYVYVPNRLGHIQGYDRLGQYAGWLGRSYNALATDIRKRGPGDNPYFRACTDDELNFRIHGLDANPAITLDRLHGRASLLGQLESQWRVLDSSRVAETHGRIRQQALSLVTSSKMHKALDIHQESPRLRDRYGRHLFGQSTLMARRLIEAGARFATVVWDLPDGYSWDSHDHSDDVERFLLPGLDQTFSALLEDLDVRGLLDETLVVCMGEMGRSPHATARWGRNHWSYCFPAVLAGAGIRGGTLHGRSDKDAAYPAAQPVSPADMAATIFWALGIDPHHRINDGQGRPVPLVEAGTPLTSLFA
jgi:hypothetical protein